MYPIAESANKECVSKVVRWAKQVYSPLRTNGLAHKNYLQSQQKPKVFAFPFEIEIIEHSDANLHTNLVLRKKDLVS